MYSRMRSRAISVAALYLMWTLGVDPMRAQTPRVADPPDLLSKLSGSLGDVAQRVSPAVVQVQVTRYAEIENADRGGANIVEKQGNVGSGFLVDSDGYIITNAHVVKGALRIRVLLTAKGRSSEVSDSLEGNARLPEQDAQIVGIDPVLDLALLKIDSTGLPTLSFADYAKLRQGQIVLAFGNPEGLENSVTMGVVSAVGREVVANVPAVYIQTDAPINHGNSGGPLVNTAGDVVGVNTFLFSYSGGSQGLGFAIPSSIVQFVYEQLREYGHVHRSAIGIELEDITPELAEGLNLPRQNGAIVADIQPDGPAAGAGLQIQDIVLSLNGRAIGSVPFAEMMIAMSPVDSILEAEVLRGRTKMTFRIPAKQGAALDDPLSGFDADKTLIRKLGVFGVEVNERFSGLRLRSGVMVAAFAANTESARADLQSGDVIHAFNGHAIETLDAFNSLLDASPTGTPGVLQIERDGRLMYVTFEVG